MRTPLRPLTRILLARQRGENPDLIERENLDRRHEVLREKTQVRASARLGRWNPRSPQTNAASSPSASASTSSHAASIGKRSKTAKPCAVRPAMTSVASGQNRLAIRSAQRPTHVSRKGQRTLASTVARSAASGPSCRGAGVVIAPAVPRSRGRASFQPLGYGIACEDFVK